MANGDAATIQSESVVKPQDAAEESGGSQASGTLGNFLLPDVMFMLLLAVFIDILDVVLALGVIVNLILGLPILAWMVWKTGEMQSAKDQIERVKRGPQERGEFRQRQQQQLAARKAATRRAWRRGILYFLGGLIRIVSIFVLWTWAVISTVRGK